MKILSLLFLIVLTNSIINCNEIISQTIKKLDDTNLFLINTINIQIDKKDKIYYFNGFYIPSDLIQLMSKNQEFNLILNQGRLPKIYKEKFYFNNYNSEIMNDDVMFDYPQGYFYYSKNYSPLKNNFPKFKNFFDVFSNVFKFALNPILDRSSFIDNNGEVYFTENSEKACTDHLDAIKEILPIRIRNEFSDIINYEDFANSDYKSIKYHIKNDKDKIIMQFKITYKLDSDKLRYNNFSAVQLIGTEYLNENENSSKIYDFSDIRDFSGEIFNIENFKYSNEIKIKYSNLKSLQIIDLVPDQLDIMLSTIKVEIYYNKTYFLFKEENLGHIFDIKIIEGIEEQNPVVPFTYENKKTLKIYFNLKSEFIENYFKSNLGEIKLNINYELRKRLLNFESYENEAEYGYKYPCGLILINKIPYITNHIYFNIPNIDNTMPFNIIALSWVVFGFIFIQILNMSLGEKGKLAKNIFQKIKERFMAKWGFLFGR